MVIETASLPTHIAQVAKRLNMVGEDASADTFLYTSYLAEVAIKNIVTVLYAGLKEKVPEDAYRLAYELVRADGLGSWEQTLRKATNQPLASFLPPEFNTLLAWLTKRRTKPEDAWFREIEENTKNILVKVGVDKDEASSWKSVRDLITTLVQIRNKTKAHGAVGQDFFDEVNKDYIAAVRLLLETCPAFSWKWMYLTLRSNKNSIRGTLLSGNDPKHIRDSEVPHLKIEGPSIYLMPEQGLRVYKCDDLLICNSECSSFRFSNGGFTEQGFAEFIDYYSGKSSKENSIKFLQSPIPLPKSKTEGLSKLDIHSNVFDNLPFASTGYVSRPRLETELKQRLLDRNHTIITLHGRGGVGKTSLALNISHELAREQSPPFEYIVWLSGRDIDLRTTGPKRTRPAVIDLETISEAYGTLFEVDSSLEGFAKVLQSPHEYSNKGILFIFDNFETMTDVSGLHQFLDTHTHIPNKVLITSRERAFKADYPIEVTGMEFAEATEMLKRAARSLHIEGIVDSEAIKEIFTYAEGHAYVMRIILGEIAKEKRYVPPSRVVSSRMDIVDAVFERSFNKLTDAGKHVFLTVSNWKSIVPELALIVVLGQNSVSVEDGIEECIRLSLISRSYMKDGQPSYHAPQLARVFGRKKLQGDPDRLAIQEDLETLRRFGTVDQNQLSRHTQDDYIQRFIKWCWEEARSNSYGSRIEQLDSILESVAVLWPDGWLELAKFRQQFVGDREQIEYALRRAVEEAPFQPKPWLERARYAKSVRDDQTRISSLLSAADSDPANVSLIVDVGKEVFEYIAGRTNEIPVARRGVYIANIRDHMERNKKSLDGDGMSILSRLYLFENDTAKAELYAQQGLEIDPYNRHCLRILDRIAE